MDYKIKFGLYYTGIQIMVIILSIMLAATLAGTILSIGISKFAIFTTIIYVAAFYKMGKWQYKTDKGKVYDITPSLDRAIKACIIPVLLQIILGIFDLMPSFKSISQQLIRLWIFPYAGFFPAKMHINFFIVWISSLILPGSVLLGYYCGIKNISLSRATDKPKKKK